jgi:hypothetical protein
MAKRWSTSADQRCGFAPGACRPCWWDSPGTVAINQFYMAALMAAPMVLIEIVLMSATYHNERRYLSVCANEHTAERRRAD